MIKDILEWDDKKTHLREYVGTQQGLDGCTELLRGDGARAVSVDGLESTTVGLFGVLGGVVVVAVHEVGELLEVNGMVGDTNRLLELFVAQSLSQGQRQRVRKWHLLRKWAEFFYSLSTTGLKSFADWFFEDVQYCCYSR